ncbi:hypothetical protein QQ045_006323 [Rhodiola kirilowii]
MDPRFKLLAIKDWLKYYGLSNDEVECRIKIIKTCLYNTYDFYKRRVTPTINNPVVTNPTNAIDATVLDFTQVFPIPLVQNFGMSRMKRARVSSGASSHTSDLQMYLDLATIEVEDDNNFNLLGCLARDLLSVPASTVASEAAFSAGEALVYFKDWSLADQRKQDTAREEEDVEELMNIMAVRPDWMTGDENGSEPQTSLVMNLKVPLIWQILKSILGSDLFIDAQRASTIPMTTNSFLFEKAYYPVLASGYFVL